MVMKGYSVFRKDPALLEPHHQIFSVINRTLVGGVLTLGRDAVDIFYNPSWLGFPLFVAVLTQCRSYRPYILIPTKRELSRKVFANIYIYFFLCGPITNVLFWTNCSILSVLHRIFKNEILVFWEVREIGKYAIVVLGPVLIYISLMETTIWNGSLGKE